MGIVKGFSNEVGDCTDSGPCHHPASTIGLLVGGAALYFGGMALDVVGAPAAARAWNARHEVLLVPTAINTPSSTATGLALSLTF